MGTIKVTIESGKDLFGAWSENVPGIYGSGETVQETKNSIIESIKLYKENNTEVPAELQGDVEITWAYDTASFMEYFSNIFSKAGLERITGINQKHLNVVVGNLKRKKLIQNGKINRRFVPNIKESDNGFSLIIKFTL